MSFDGQDCPISSYLPELSKLFYHAPQLHPLPLEREQKTNPALANFGLLLSSLTHPSSELDAKVTTLADARFGSEHRSTSDFSWAKHILKA